MKSPIIALAALSSFLGTITSAVAYEVCEEFTVHWAVDHVHSLDHDRDGRSVGDTMMVKGTMTTTSGVPVGPMYVNSTVMPYGEEITDEDPIPFFATMHYIFPTGRLSTSGIFERHDTGLNKDLPPVQFEYSIIGGTGLFASARGQMVASTDEDGNRTLNFRISCAD
ncbi:MAG: hypothetical protein AAGB11_00095 [Pseudomonadota bacterium]